MMMWHLLLFDDALCFVLLSLCTVLDYLLHSGRRINDGEEDVTCHKK